MDKETIKKKNEKYGLYRNGMANHKIYKYAQLALT
jgi:hypothetical protein